MNSTYNINGKTFSTFNVFKPIATGEKIAILYTAGIKSHLLALMAKQIYGIENIVFVLNTPEEFANFKNNPTKLTKAKNNFTLGLEKLNAIHSIHNTEGLFEQHKFNYDLIMEKINGKFSNVKFIFAGHNNMHQETIQLLLDSGWDKGLLSVNELKEYLDNNSSKYPELYYYTKNLDYKIPAVNRVLGFEQINHYYQSVQKPFANLTTTNIIKFYEILSLKDKIFESVSCPVLTTKLNCGYCSDCLGKKYALSQAGIEDTTDYS